MKKKRLYTGEPVSTTYPPTQKQKDYLKKLGLEGRWHKYIYNRSMASQMIDTLKQTPEGHSILEQEQQEQQRQERRRQEIQQEAKAKWDQREAEIDSIMSDLDWSDQ